MLLFFNIKMTVDENNLLQESRKENCFRFLAGSLYYPEKSVFEEAELFNKLTEYLKDVCPEALPFSTEMGKNFAQYSENELQVEYSRLFKGPYELIAAPYGSVYLDEGRRVMGDSTIAVIQAYEEEGLAKNDDFKDLPDHIVVELEFMSFLLFKEIEAIQDQDSQKANEYQEKQQRFLNMFLRQWVPSFCEKIKNGSDNQFYISLSNCLSTFIMNPKF